MCIICNLTRDDDPHGGGEVAIRYLNAFEQSQLHMKAAATAMLECSKRAPDPADRRRYDAIHKMMVRQIKEWNKLEQKREH